MGETKYSPFWHKIPLSVDLETSYLLPGYSGGQSSDKIEGRMGAVDGREESAVASN